MRCAVILSLAALAVAAPLSQSLEARQDDLSSILAALEADSPDDAQAAKGALNTASAPVARAAADDDDDDEQLDAQGYELDTRTADDDDDDEQLDAQGYELDTRKTKEEKEEEQEEIADGEEDP